MAFVITEPCIGTKNTGCVAVCPVDCIHSANDQQQYYINPDECIDWGACEAECQSTPSSPRTTCRRRGSASR